MSPQNEKKKIDKEQLDLYLNESGISVSLTSFAAAIDFVFIGLLLTGDQSLQVRLRVPLILLFLSAFGFIYASLIFANASGKVSRLDYSTFEKYMHTGNIVSEYFGVYGLIFAVPLVILGYSPDPVLPLVILLISVLGFSFYQFSRFSILSRRFSGFFFFLMVFLFLATLVVAFIFFYYHMMFRYHIVSTILLLLIFILFFISLSRQEA